MFVRHIQDIMNIMVYEVFCIISNKSLLPHYNHMRNLGFRLLVQLHPCLHHPHPTGY